MAARDRWLRRLTAVGLLALGLTACGDDGPPTSLDDDPPARRDLGSMTDLPAAAPRHVGLFDAPGLEALRPRPRLGWPVLSVHITSSFGWRVDPVSGRGVRLHRGLDLRGAIGDLVLSIGDGHVEFVGHDPLLGTMVIIDHGDGLTSLYGHLSDVLVVADVEVDRGAAIGLVGNTGRSAAPHLHLTVKLDGQAIDPLEVIGEPHYRPVALATPIDAPVGDPGSDPESAPPSTGPTPPLEPPPDAHNDRPTGSVPPRHPLPHRSDDGGVH